MDRVRAVRVALPPRLGQLMFWRELRAIGSAGFELANPDRNKLIALVGRGGFRTRPSDILAVVGRLSSSLRSPWGFSPPLDEQRLEKHFGSSRLSWLGEEDSNPH